MGYMPLTPFGRTVDAVLLKHQQAAGGGNLHPAVSKWDALKELSVARKTYGLNDRDMSVLQALISFLPGKMLDLQGGPQVIHPSNQTICERLNGMPCSTMRRHVAKLVQAGILIRRDSPNGKRYVRRYGGDRVAYGFDLSPLVARFAEFSQAADAERQSAARIKRLRETITLMRRDLMNLALLGEAEYPASSIWDQFLDLARLTARDLRRKLNVAELEQIIASLQAGISQSKEHLESFNSPDLSSSDTQIEQHYQNSKKDSFESEQAVKPVSAYETGLQDKCSIAEKPEEERPMTRETPAPATSRPAPDGPNISLRLILSACGEIQTYADAPIKQWDDLLRAAGTVRPMMGISATVWEEAKTAMGAAEASAAVAAMLERFADIRSPGAYLRHLSSRASAGQFSCGPMVMALLHQKAAA